MTHAHKTLRRNETQTETARRKVTRRDFLKASGVLIAGISAGVPITCAYRTIDKAKLCFGIVTDAHYADAANMGTRHYKESVAKMRECIILMNKKKVDFLVELGDFKDQSKPASEESTLKYLKTIEKVYGQFKGPRYHVLGNHDVDSISKEQFLTYVENTGIPKGSKYYSFDSKGFHFIVLDANYTADGSDYDHGKFDWTDTNIPDIELDWLQNDLASTSTPAIAFVHQQLGGQRNHSIKNAAQVRQILQESQKILAVFQGHYHPGQYSAIEDIHYYTLKAMVEGSGAENTSYAIVEVYDKESIIVTGYGKALSKEMGRA
jgi:predicted phosphodiesterase